MKIAFLGDVHFGARGNSDFFLDRQLEFFDDLFFPYLIENKIDRVVQFGDLLDQRKFINVRVLYNIQKNYLQKFEDLGIKQDIILGNHDIVYNNTSRISGLVEVADKKTFSNTTVHQEPTTLDFDGCKIDLIPWINKENEKEIEEFIVRSSSNYLIGHLEINNFEMVSGIECKNGIAPTFFKDYTIVFSGHFHKQSKKKIKGTVVHYIGTPYELNWGDYGIDKGFHIFDTETGETEFIKNKNPIYHKLIYDDKTVNYDSFDASKYKNSICKIIVENKENDLMFDRLLHRIQKNCHDYLISDFESFDVSGNDMEKIDVEDSLSVLLKSVDSLKDNLDKESIKGKIIEIHRYAEDMMVSQ